MALKGNMSKKRDYPIMMRNTVLVKLTEGKKTDIVLPESVKEDQKMAATTGWVVSAGPECKQVSKNDFVFYKSYVGNILEHEGFKSDETLVVVSEDDIIGIL